MRWVALSDFQAVCEARLESVLDSLNTWLLCYSHVSPGTTELYPGMWAGRPFSKAKEAYVVILVLGALAPGASVSPCVGGMLTPTPRLSGSREVLDKG